MAQNNPVLLNEIHTNISERPDDLFLCWGSPEERCKGGALKLVPGYKAKNAVILRYSGHKSEEREKNVAYLEKRLNTVGNAKTVFIEEEIPLPSIKDTVMMIEKMLSDIENPTLTIDISTPIKWHLLIILKFLDFNGLLNNVRFIYTEPKDYHTNLFQPLSFGIKEIFPIPLCYGNYDFSNEDLLVLMLGYEGSRAVAMFENIDPASVVTI